MELVRKIASTHTTFNAEDIRAIEQGVKRDAGVRIFDNLASLFTPQGGGLSITIIFFFVAGALMTVYLIYGGISLMTSQGDPKNVMAAKQIITNAFIGILIVIFAYWMVQIAGSVLALPGIQSTF